MKKRGGNKKKVNDIDKWEGKIEKSPHSQNFSLR